MSRLLIFANPISGQGRALRAASRLLHSPLAQLHSIHLTFTPPPGTPWPIVPEADTAIVIGGDGTLRDVTQFLLNNRPNRIPPLLIIPLGTANLMGRHLRINWNHANLAAEVQRALYHHRIVHLDAGSIGNEIFLLMIGVGFDGAIIHELSGARTGPITVASYFAPALRAMAGYDFPELQVSVDGKVVFPRGRALAAVANVSEYGTGFPVIPHARPDDRLLDVLVMPCASRAELIALTMSAAAGDLPSREGVVSTRGKQITIESPTPIPVQADGEAAGFTPVTVNLLATQIPFIVPVT